MEINRMLALVWKEFRQLRLSHLAFYFIDLLAVYTVFSVLKDSEYRFIQSALRQVVYFMLPCLAFFYGAGNRVTDASCNVEIFLTLRPIRLSNMLLIYYWMGLLGWIFWLLIYLLLQIGFFGPDIIRVVGGGSSMESPLISYTNFTFIYLLIYTIAFALGVLIPNFVLCILGCFGSYYWLLFWILSEYGMHQGIGDWFSGGVYAVLLIPIPVICALTYGIYKNLQLGKRDAALT